ncbi:MoaF-related domain-containing protein [Mesorhizobium sp. BHbdii]
MAPTELHVQATIGATQIDEVVKSDLTGVRPDLFIMSWTEQSGNFVVQVQDHETKVVHNYARLADGQLFCAQGVIQPVPAA